ncbi:GrpB family protein [Nocardioides currus]|uniref:GrpB family protein n=1 Tax=Nocardioides currus TaxID=2133958 RepID=A0A2R7YTX0_9ACTN|nr:GrpB family protein [Nocardioides currus]PUA79319.1 GrpB family protein [Nocardioides currus]
MIEVVDWSPVWAVDFERVAVDLRRALATVPGARVEHVGSTSVPGLAAKPILDIDVIVERVEVPAAVAALVGIGYHHRGDLGVTGREAFSAPDASPRRHVYVCEAGTVNVRNHLAVRDTLRVRDDLRDAYAEVKLSLATDPDLDIDTYIARKSAVVQRVLDASGEFSEDELAAIHRLNDPTSPEATACRT